MASTLSFYSTRDAQGFLSNFFPAPFNAPGTVEGTNVRYRTVEHYFQSEKTNDPQRQEEIRNAISPSEAVRMGDDVTHTQVRPDWEEVVNTPEAQRIATLIGVDAMRTKDMVMLEGLMFKFEQNPVLAVRLKRTAPRLLVDASPDDAGNMLGRLLTYLRDNVISYTDTANDDSYNILFENFYRILREQGFTRITAIGNDTVNIPLDSPDIPRTDVRGMMLSGRTVGEGPSAYTETALVDIFLTNKYPEERLKEVIEKYKNMVQKPQYLIVGQVAKTGINKILARISAYNNITFYSPSQLFIIPSANQLSPRVEAISEDDDRYLEARSGVLAEISAFDPLMQEKRFMRGTILRVYDFSPHYRIVV